MGNLASGHFKPTNKIQEQHNDRTLSPSYLLPKEFRGQNEVNRYSKQAMILKNQIIENAHETYLITFKQKSQAKSYQWSLVVNTKETTTMSDLEKLAEHFEIKYGFQCYQIAIHRDEGYMDENNQPHINHHAHMEFITLNKENGKNMMRKAHLSPKKFADMQTEIAQILGMERGTDKRVSGIERIEPHKYAQMKNKERKERLKDAKLIDELTNSMSELNAHATTLKQELETKKKEISTLKDTNLEQKEQENENLKQENKKLEQENADLNNEITTALDAANIGFQKKEATLQEAVSRIKKNSEILSVIYNFLEHIAPNYVSEMTEKYKQVEFFAKTFGVVKKLKELYSNIVKILFGDENAKKDPQEIEQKIKELSERPTKSDFEYRKKCHKEAVKHYQEAEKIVFNGKKNSWLLVTDYDAKKLNERLTELVGKESKLNTLKSTDLALDLEKAQERIQTLESNEIALMGVLYDKENIIQNKGRTINRLKKELKELEYNYRQNRERMVAENKHLKEQGLEKIYTQKDYEDLKKAHHQEVEELKKQIQKYKTQETNTPTKRM
ncbi:hypothetical protein [Helicobacter pylori]|uniref:hypothetical protein n=1 Tax=Helicobacter pylori TaxID=210 RepID=UPI001A98C81F|nr:hypothetical protein [Helicobacter pylori]